MRLFSSQERENIKNIIIEELKKIDNVISIILVGSGSVGFTDDLSDLDFSIVINNVCDISAIMKQVKDLICSRWEFLDVLEMQNRGLQVFIINNYLEVDIGYVPFENVSAVRDKWLVVYDKTDKIESIMKQTWEINKNNHGKKEKVDVEQVYASANKSIWHYLMHAIVAIKREKYWRAVGEMDLARNMLIELLGLKYSLETKRFRNVDMFPDEIKIILQKTVPTEFRLVAFTDSISTLIDVVYDELEGFYSNSDELKVTREDVKQYGRDILSNF